MTPLQQGQEMGACQVGRGRQGCIEWQGHACRDASWSMVAPVNCGLSRGTVGFNLVVVGVLLAQALGLVRVVAEHEILAASVALVNGALWALAGQGSGKAQQVLRDEKEELW